MANTVVAFPAISSAGAVVPIRAVDTGGGVYALSVSGLFSPASIPGLTLWFDADSIAGVDGAAIATWPGSGGLPSATQSTASLQPILKKSIINGKAVARFDGTDDTMLIAEALTAKRVFFVAKYGASGSFPDYQAVFSGQNLTPGVMGAPSSTDWDGGSAVFTTGGVLGMINDIPINSFKIVSAETTTSTETGWRISGDRFVDRFWKGDIASIITYDATLTTAQQVSIEQYLASLYAIKNCVFLGNSLTSGFGISAAKDFYPSQAFTLQAGAILCYNRGIPGQTTQDMQAAIATQATAYYNASVAKNIGVFWEITNDLFFGGSAASAYANAVTYCQSLRAIGYKVVILTVLPRSDAGTPLGFEVARTTVNANIVANWASFADGIYDCAGDARIGDFGDQLDPTYYQSDQVHLNATGYAIIATGVSAVISTL